MAPYLHTKVKQTSHQWAKLYGLPFDRKRRRQLYQQLGDAWAECDFFSTPIFLAEFAGRLFACHLFADPPNTRECVDALTFYYLEVLSEFGFGEWRSCPEGFREFLERSPN